MTELVFFVIKIIFILKKYIYKKGEENRESKRRNKFDTHRKEMEIIRLHGDRDKEIKTMCKIILFNFFK